MLVLVLELALLTLLPLAVSGEEETKELHAHGVYSSSHLLALKLTAEMQYWMWRQAPAPEVSAQPQRSHARCFPLVHGTWPVSAHPSGQDTRPNDSLWSCSQRLLTAETGSGFG